MTLLYTLAYWHGLAKMRLHTDSSVALFEDSTSALGVRLRHFAYATSPCFSTKETEKEHEARTRAALRRATASGVPTPTSSTRQPRTFNLRTVKNHFLGDYPEMIRLFGSLEGYSTMVVRTYLFQIRYGSS